MNSLAGCGLGVENDPSVNNDENGGHIHTRIVGDLFAALTFTSAASKAIYEDKDTIIHIVDFGSKIEVGRVMSDYLEIRSQHIQPSLSP